MVVATGDPGVETVRTLALGMGLALGLTFAGRTFSPGGTSGRLFTFLLFDSPPLSSPLSALSIQSYPLGGVAGVALGAVHLGVPGS